MQGQRKHNRSRVSLFILLALAYSGCDDTGDRDDEGGEALGGQQAGTQGGDLPIAGARDGGEMNSGELGGSGGEMIGGIGGEMIGGGAGQMLCEPNTSTECISETEQSVCDATGLRYTTVSCPQGLYCLRGLCGDQRCEPGVTRCLPQDPSRVFVCDPLGVEWIEGDLCEQGLACQNGACMSRCEAAAKLNTYIGCEYWTVDLDNYPDPFTIPMPNEVPHSVVISNPGDQSATVRFETRAGVTLPTPQGEVPPGEVRAFTMPRLDVDNSGITNHSIKVSSSMPVIAYQFNPLNNANVYSNDASLLLPVNTLGRSYLVTSWPTGVNTENFLPTGIIPQAGYFTVVAVSPGETSVTVTVTAPTEAGPNVPELSAGETATFTLSQFDVLNLQAQALTPADFFELIGATPHDLTGSVVEATQPVAVFGGHEEAVIGFDQGPNSDNCCADHLEEQLLPIATWSDEALCVKVKPRSTQGEKDIWRILSGVDGNSIQTTPAISGLNGITLNRGEWVQVEAAESFKVRGSGALQATQYMISQGQTDEGTGDPSMILAVPTERYRSQYNILVPMGYGDDWVTIIRPIGATVQLDGAPVSESFTTFADGAWEYAYVPVTTGAHEISGSLPFGLVAYGWNNAVSYGYPAGLNLENGMDE